MKTRVGVVAVLAGLVATGAFYATSAVGRAQVSSCTKVRVTGGNFNGLTGGVVVAGVGVRNVGTRDCTINARPWIRLGPIRYPVTVGDATSDMFGEHGASEGTLTLHSGDQVGAQVFIAPGSCDRGVGTTFPVRARAGWAQRGVAVSNGVCKDGTGEIFVGAFRR